MAIFTASHIGIYQKQCNHLNQRVQETRLSWSGPYDDKAPQQMVNIEPSLGPPGVSNINILTRLAVYIAVNKIDI